MTQESTSPRPAAWSAGPPSSSSSGPSGAPGGRPPFGGRPGPGGPPRRGGRRGRFIPRRKVCAFCVDHVTYIDYKNAATLRRYLSDRAKIDPRRKTGTCAKHQRGVALALKRARHLALLPFTADQALDIGGRR